MTPASGRIHSRNSCGASASAPRWVFNAPGRNLAGRDLAHDLGEVVGLRVAAREERRLALVELRVREGDVVPHDAHQDVASAVPDEAEAALHRADVAGRVDHHVEAVAGREVLHLLLRRRIGEERAIRAQPLDREAQAVLARVHHRQIGPARLGER